MRDRVCDALRTALVSETKCSDDDLEDAEDLADLGLDSRRLPAIAFVHGGPDPYLDRPLDAWLSGDQAFVSLYALLNRLCRSGAIVPGQYAVTRPH